MDTNLVDVLSVLEPLVCDVVGVALRLTVEPRPHPLGGRRVLRWRHDVGVACNNSTTPSVCVTNRR